MYYLPPLLSSIAYGILAVIVLRDAKTRERKLFGVYLLISLYYAVLIFIVLLGTFPSQTRLLTSFFMMGGLAAMIAYYHFVRVFTHSQSNSIAVKIGYSIIVFIVAPLSVLGYMPQEAYLVGNGLYVDYGPFQYLMTSVGMTFVALSAYTLFKRYRSLERNRQERSRLLFLGLGLVVFLAFSFREAIPPLPKFPYNQVGHLCNALVITYVIMKYQLFNIRLIIRQGLVYSSMTIIITALYLTILSVLQYSIVDWTSKLVGWAIIIGMAILMALLFNWLKTILQRIVDKFFYGNTYEHRKLLQNFHERMGNVLELSELAESMLEPITKAVKAEQASLLLPDEKYFRAHYAARLDSSEPVVPIKIRNHSLLTNWLRAKNVPVTRDQIRTAPELKSIWKDDNDSFDSANVEVLFPMRSKDSLIGILALSKKKLSGTFSSDDMELLGTLSRNVAVVIDNAQLYAEAKRRANVDELTGLFNHRHFHQRLDEEILRSSRFGEIFSIIYMDLDVFKSYNDIYGHVEGDKILQQIGKKISQSIRSVDIGARYGGDEFAIILPHTSADDAVIVAERIRGYIEDGVDSKGMAVTCSLGIASWPTDGLMREEIIAAADGALYHAKHTGRNRACKSSEVALAEVMAMQSSSTKNDKAMLSTIYALAATVDAKDHYTYGHSKKVSTYAAAIGRELDLPEDRINTLRTVGLLHDIGKIGISDQILRKIGPLSVEDWEPIHAHPNLGVSILKHIELLHDCLAGIKHHHEHYDGSGYPDGLKGDNIPLDARILCVADSYDAMTSKRPYRDKFTTDVALRELDRCSGTQFDPDIVAAFKKVITEDQEVGIIS